MGDCERDNMGEKPQHIRQQFGSYITTKVMGSGEQSAVYAAIHETSGKMFALRVLTIQHKDVEQALSDCNAVLEELSELDIPNAVKIQDFGHDDSTLYIAMTILNGGTLLERMNIRVTNQESPQLPSPADILKMTERIAIALDTLHQQGLVHGQIQPHSILFNDRGQAFLSEIGMTRIMKIIYSLDATNSFKMTRYSPPELWIGERPSGSTDQYALACIIYQLLTGKVPFDGPSIFSLMQAHSNDVAVPPHYVRQDLPSSLAMVFWQALAKPSDRRYPTIRSFYQDLRKSFADSDDMSAKTDFFTFLLD